MHEEAARYIVLSLLPVWCASDQRASARSRRFSALVAASVLLVAVGFLLKWQLVVEHRAAAQIVVIVVAMLWILRSLSLAGADAIRRERR